MKWTKSNASINSFRYPRSYPPFFPFFFPHITLCFTRRRLFGGHCFSIQLRMYNRSSSSFSLSQQREIDAKQTKQRVRSVRRREHEQALSLATKGRRNRLFQFFSSPSSSSSSSSFFHALFLLELDEQQKKKQRKKYIGEENGSKWCDDPAAAAAAAAMFFCDYSFCRAERTKDDREWEREGKNASEHARERHRHSLFTMVNVDEIE